MDTKDKILELIHDLNQDDTEGSVFSKKLAERLNIDQSAVSRHLTDLEEDGLIYRQNGGRTKFLYLTDRGKDHITGDGDGLNHPLKGQGSPPSDDSGGGAEYEGVVDFHKNSIGFEILNREDLVRGSEALDWRNRWVEVQEKDWTYNSENDSYECEVKNWDIQLTREKVFIKVGRVRTEDVDSAAWKVYEDAMEARDWVEDHSPLRLSGQPYNMKIWTSERHIADVKNPLAQWIRDHTDIDLEEFKVYDEEGNLRLWMDDSMKEAHLEASGDWDRDDIDHVRGHYAWMVQNKDTEKALREVPDEVDRQASEMEDLKDIADTLLRLRMMEEIERGRVPAEDDTKDDTQGRESTNQEQYITLDGVKCENTPSGWTISTPDEAPSQQGRSVRGAVADLIDALAQWVRGR